MKTSKYKNIPTLVREGRTTIPLQKKNITKGKTKIYSLFTIYIHIRGSSLTTERE